jgi:hypothetical protein
MCCLIIPLPYGTSYLNSKLTMLSYYWWLHATSGMSNPANFAKRIVCSACLNMGTSTISLPPFPSPISRPKAPLIRVHRLWYTKVRELDACFREGENASDRAVEPEPPGLLASVSKVFFAFIVHTYLKNSVRSTVRLYITIRNPPRRWLAVGRIMDESAQTMIFPARSMASQACSQSSTANFTRPGQRYPRNDKMHADKQCDDLGDALTRRP